MGGGAVIDLGNKRDIADYLLRVHGGLRCSASASVDSGGGGGGGHETATSEVSAAEEDEAEDVISLAEDYVH